MILSLDAVLERRTIARLIEADDAALTADLLREKLCANDRFRRAVQPLRFGPAEIMVIDEGTQSQPPADVAGALRADIEIVCFLTDPQACEGGELLIDTGYGDVARKGGAGSCVVYPATAKLRWNPVSQGASRIARMGVQSCVRDVQQRAILYDLTSAADFFDLAGMTEPVQTLRRCNDLLIGLWAEP